MYNQLGEAKENTVVVGERALVSLYGGAKEDELDILRYKHHTSGSAIIVL